MRTVTFSDPAVVKLMNESFICAWTNKRPFARFQDGIYKDKKIEALPNGTAPDNVTSVFAAWDGTVIHAMSGSLDAAEFKKQVVFARDLHDQLYEGVGRKMFAGAVYMGAHKEAFEKAPNPLARQMHWRLSKSFTGIRDWYPTLFDMLFGKHCAD